MAIAFVQEANSHGIANSLTLATTVSALTTGNWLFVATTTATAGIQKAITVNSGAVQMNHLISVGTTTTPCDLFYGKITTGGATTVTVSNVLTNALAMVVLEFSAATTLLLDAFNQANSAGGATPALSGSTLTTAVANQLWIGAAAWRNQTFTSATINGVAPTGSYSDGTTYIASTGDRHVSMAYTLASATGTPHYDVTLGAADINNGLIATFMEVPSGGGGAGYSRGREVNV